MARVVLPKCSVPECDGNARRGQLCEKHRRDWKFLIWALNRLHKDQKEKGQLPGGLISLDSPEASVLMRRGPRP